MKSNKWNPWHTRPFIKNSYSFRMSWISIICKNHSCCINKIVKAYKLEGKVKSLIFWLINGALSPFIHFAVNNNHKQIDIQQNWIYRMSCYTTYWKWQHAFCAKTTAIHMCLWRGSHRSLLKHPNTTFVWREIRQW